VSNDECVVGARIGQRVEDMDKRLTKVENVVAKMPFLIVTTVSTLIAVILAAVKLWTLN